MKYHQILFGPRKNQKSHQKTPAGIIIKMKLINCMIGVRVIINDEMTIIDEYLTKYTYYIYILIIYIYIR